MCRPIAPPSDPPAGSRNWLHPAGGDSETGREEEAAGARSRHERTRAGEDGAAGKDGPGEYGGDSAAAGSGNSGYGVCTECSAGSSGYGSRFPGSGDAFCITGCPIGAGDGLFGAVAGYAASVL